MRLSTAIVFCLAGLLYFSFKQPARITFIRVDLSGAAQGTTWHVTYYAEDTLVKNGQVDSILAVIDTSLSIYKPFSRIVEFNKSTTGVSIDDHFRRVIEKSLDTYQQTTGYFDITILPIVEAWGFAAKSIDSLPDSATIRTLLKCVGSKYLQLDGNRLTKLRPCVKIDVNGIAQGYSVDVIAGFLRKKGIENFLVELGGELRVQGKKQPGNELFHIGIEAPSDNEFNTPPIRKIIVVDSGGITTSGNYRKYYESKGKKISHLMDPNTGYPIQNEMISVTVYAKDAITADAYDNALMAMGVKKALKFLDQRQDLAGFFIYRLPNGNIADTASSRFYKFIQ